MACVLATVVNSYSSNSFLPMHMYQAEEWRDHAKTTTTPLDPSNSSKSSTTYSKISMNGDSNINNNNNNTTHNTLTKSAPAVNKNNTPVIETTPLDTTMMSQGKERLWEITKPFANVTTIGFKMQRFPSGYRNQIQSFSAFVVLAGIDNHSQILMPTLSYKDTHGTNQFMPFEFLLDVEHWNSFYPALPRMVHCDQELFLNNNCTGGHPQTTNDTTSLLHWSERRFNNLFLIYMRYSMKQRGPMMAAVDDQGGPPSPSRSASYRRSIAWRFRRQWDSSIHDLACSGRARYGKAPHMSGC
jgi:hypothetical protein